MMGLIGVGLQLVSGLASSGKSEGKEGKEDNPIKSLIDPLGIMGGKDKQENPIEKLLSLFTGGGGGLLGGGGGGLSLLG